jgi:hypothetical protein
VIFFIGIPDCHSNLISVPACLQRAGFIGTQQDFRAMLSPLRVDGCPNVGATSRYRGVRLVAILASALSGYQVRPNPLTRCVVVLHSDS